jgi:hypothetical protein
MANFAVVTGVYEDGLGLRIEGESAGSQKHYQCNAFEVFHTGDRVRIVQDGNTYVAEYVVGNPKTTFAADTATSATAAGSADSATVADRVADQNNTERMIYFEVTASGVLKFKSSYYSKNTWYQLATT